MLKLRYRIFLMLYFFTVHVLLHTKVCLPEVLRETQSTVGTRVEGMLRCIAKHTTDRVGVCEISARLSTVN